MSLPQDILGVIRGLQAVVQAGIRLQESSCRVIWQNSSVKALAEECLTNARKAPTSEANKNSADVTSFLKENSDRLFTVIDGIKQYAALSTKTVLKGKKC